MFVTLIDVYIKCFKRKMSQTKETCGNKCFEHWTVLCVPYHVFSVSHCTRTCVLKIMLNSHRLVCFYILTCVIPSVTLWLWRCKTKQWTTPARLSKTPFFGVSDGASILAVSANQSGVIHCLSKIYVSLFLLTLTFENCHLVNISQNIFWAHLCTR